MAIADSYRKQVSLLIRTIHLVAAEKEFAVPPLADDEAAELFVSRAQAANANFELSEQNAAAVANTHFFRSTGTLTTDQSPAFSMKAGSPTKLQIILPGQTAVPGNLAAGGKSGSITAATAGDPYTITTRLTDNWFNAIGNASQSAIPATPSSAAVPTAAITKCEFVRTPCQKEGRMS